MSHRGVLDYAGVMRLWSLHPRLLDRQALIACWREALLAQKVLRGLTKGYRNHPQLDRFRAADGDRPAQEADERTSVRLIGAFLRSLADEAEHRGYNFNRELITVAELPSGQLEVSRGQLAFELEHLKAKSRERSTEWFAATLAGIDADNAEPHPLFNVVEGPRAPWERG